MPPGEPVAIYQYVTTHSQNVLEKGRWELPDGNKEFLWRRKGGTWEAGIHPLRVRDVALWGVEALGDAPLGRPVVFCEGEECVKTCRDAGLLAVCAPGSASGRDFGDALEPLRGRPVELWPDVDKPGREYMRHVANVVAPTAAALAWPRRTGSAVSGQQQTKPQVRTWVRRE